MVRGFHEWNETLRGKPVMNRCEGIHIYKGHTFCNECHVGGSFPVLLCETDDRWVIKSHPPRNGSPRLQVRHGDDFLMTRTKNVLLE